MLKSNVTPILFLLAALDTGGQTGELRLRVSVNLIQVDATVTDGRGNPVPGLTREDFRVLVDGRPQTLESVDYIQTRAAPAPSAPAPRAEPAKRAASQPAMPAAPLLREQVRRTVVLFVDDINLSAEAAPSVRAGLRRFLERDFRPGDLAAIVRAGAGLGALQDFTNDRRLLLAAADQVRWRPQGRGAMNTYAQFGRPGLLGSSSLEVEEQIALAAGYAVSVTNSLRRLVNGMASLPGRKSVVILSENLPIETPDETDPNGFKYTGSGKAGPILAAMRRVVDECLRAGVVLYAIDTRGLKSLVPLASDGLKPATADAAFGTPAPENWVWEASQARRDEYKEGQWGALFLASETGGFMVTEANRVDAAVERVMADQSGYYLLSFKPSEEALAPGRDGRPLYRSLRVEVQGMGLRVRSHHGFFGVPDEDRAAARSAPELTLASSLESPLRAGGIRMEVQSGYLSASKDQAFLRTAVVIDGRDLVLAGPPVHRTGVIQLLVRAFAVGGDEMSGGIDQMLRIDLNEDGYERALKYGLIYTALIPVRKPGPYQVRAACRDGASGKIGNGSDFVVVPQVGKRQLALSGLVFRSLTAVDDHVRPATGSNDYAPGERADFAYQVINARDPGKLSAKVALFRDGKQIYQAPEEPVRTESGKTGARFFAHSALQIPSGLEAGEYFLRVTVRDGPSESWQWARIGVR